MTKKYRVFAIHNGQPHGGPIGEYETLGQLRKHKQRLDRVEAVVQRKKDDGIRIRASKGLLRRLVELPEGANRIFF